MVLINNCNKYEVSLDLVLFGYFGMMFLEHNGLDELVIAN